MFPKSCLKVATEVFILQSVVFLKCPTLSNIFATFQVKNNCCQNLSKRPNLVTLISSVSSKILNIFALFKMLLTLFYLLVIISLVKT